MALSFVETDNLDVDPHRFRVYEIPASDRENWLESLAEEYIKLLTRREAKARRIVTSKDTDLDMSRVHQYLKKACLPEYNGGKFNVVRSDFGELLCYMLLERDYSTLFAPKSLRTRELTDQSGRGIDAIGIEEGNIPSLVLCEVKVSGEQQSPPQVVDTGNKSLRSQHRYHIEMLYEKTKKKVWKAVRDTRDEYVATLLEDAAMKLENRRLDKLRVIACCVLVRPVEIYQRTDFGSFRTDPTYYDPAIVRFLIACVPDDIDATINKWYSVIQGTEESE
jgi:hypothetical protein